MTLRQKISIPAIGLFVIITAMFLVTWRVTSQQKNDGLVINLAGRQRMLSQKMTKEILYFHTLRNRTGADEAELAKQVKNTMKVFDITLAALTDSGKAPLSLDLTKTQYRHCPRADEPAYSQLKKVVRIWQEFSKHMQTIIQNTAQAEESMQWILKNNLSLLAEMNSAVGMMQNQSEEKVKFLLTSQMAGILAGVCLMALSVFVIRFIIKTLNNVITKLRLGANQVTVASDQVSSAGQSLAEGATEQAASIEETSSSLEEMSSMTRQNAEHANRANNLVEEANQAVSHANGSMSELTTSMHEISTASEETSKIIKTIDEIAFQTNLLALNAAVEAARAGEAGAGFAVVADEVRTLAMRAAEAAKNTAEIIEVTVKKVEDGENLVNRTNDTFSEVAESTSKVGALISEIAGASNEQAQGIEQINVAVAEMDKVVQQNAAGAEESASASEEMKAQAEQMKAMVEEMVALVGGSTNGARPGPVPASRASATGAHTELAAPTKKAEKVPVDETRKASPERVVALEDDFKDF